MNPAAELTRRLDESLASGVGDPGIRDELAFHLAEVIRDVIPLVEALEKKDTVPSAIVLSLAKQVLYHWPYHQKAIRRTLDANEQWEAKRVRKKKRSAPGTKRGGSRSARV